FDTLSNLLNLRIIFPNRRRLAFQCAHGHLDEVADCLSISTAPLCHRPGSQRPGLRRHLRRLASHKARAFADPKARPCSRAPELGFHESRRRPPFVFLSRPNADEFDIHVHAKDKRIQALQRACSDCWSYAYEWHSCRRAPDARPCPPRPFRSKKTQRLCVDRSRRWSGCSSCPDWPRECVRQSLLIKL